MVARFRKWEGEELQSGRRAVRQYVVAVTANGSQIGKDGESGFDELCAKPLGVTDIERVVNHYLQEKAGKTDSV